MTDRPTGTVTFLFTDIEGSTGLWERYPEAMSEALTRHDEILRSVVEVNGGRVVKTAGDGVHAAFSAATDALEAARQAQRALLRKEWAETGPLRVRMALHTGATEERDGDYYGPPVNRAARLLSAGHGGQVLLSLPTQELVRDQLPSDVHLRDLGERRLKDLSRPERIYQLAAPDLPSEFPPLKTLERYPSNLPLQTTPLIGREREVEEVCRRLRVAEVRILTLTGPGGTGKTRVSVQAAAELMDEYEDGVLFVALAAIADPMLVIPTITRTLGLTEASNQPPEEVLKGYLHDRHVLLVLDNFEQVLEAAPVMDEVLHSAPGVKALVTSRTPLRLYGEHEFPIPPLSLPESEATPSAEHLADYGAIRLFLDRVRAVNPEFPLTEENARAVAEICERLDGLPLAIELAAARAKLLPPRALLSRLDNRLKLLTGGARNLPERQRTLRNTIEWSYEMLDEDEKTLFARLAVFSGGGTLEAVEAVCDAEGDLHADPLEGVSSLLDKSMLRQEVEQGDEPRFEMLETIREFALEKLEESADAEAVRRVHAEYYLALAEQAEPRLWGPEDAAWLERLEQEHDNMRAALSWTLEHEKTELALRLGGALRWFWFAEGYYGEGRTWLEEALLKDGWTSADARVKSLDGVAWLAHEQGDIDRAEKAAEEGLGLSAKAGSRSLVAGSFQNILGEAARHRGDHERALEILEDSLALYREAQDKRGIAWTLGSLAIVSSDHGDYGRAKELYEEGLRLSRELGSASPLGDYLISLGYESLLEGDLERATALNMEAAELYRNRGRRGGLQYALDNLGWATLLRGDYEDADALYRESLTLSRDLGDKLIASESIEGLACVAGTRGDARRAARLFGAAQAQRDSVGYLHTSRESVLREPYLAAARSQLVEAAWTEVWTKGHSMTFEEAIVYALEEDASNLPARSRQSG